MTSGETLSMLPESPLLFLMDGHALVHRAWHAIQEPLTVRGTGEDVRAVYGFLNTFLREVSDRNPTHCAIAFDLPTPTFRHERFKEYKAQRPPTPPELRSQFSRVRELVEVLGIPVYEMPGYEADDVLGTLAKQAEAQEIDALILTGDTDTLQLVSPRVRVLLNYGVQRKNLYDVAAVRERYGGLGPMSLPEVKALQGDSSDNIPGLPGIGAKTAIRLISEHGSLEGIYQHLDQITQPRLHRSLQENRETAFEGRELTTIVRDVPIELDLEAARYGAYDRSKVVELLRELEFHSIVPRVPGRSAEADTPEEDEPQRPQTRYSVVATEDALEEMAGTLASAGSFSFNVLGTSEHALHAELVGMAFSTEPGLAWYLPLGHAEGRQLPVETALAQLGPLLADESIAKTTHNANYALTVLGNHGVQECPIAFDTTLAAHFNGKSPELKPLALELLNEELQPLTDLTGTGRKRIAMSEVSIEAATGYASAAADYTDRLRVRLEQELEENENRAEFDEVEMRLAPVLVRMQHNGVALDSRQLEQMAAELGEQLSAIESGMYELVGHELNIGSSKQLGEVLFEELRLPKTRRTKTGYSTDASSLEGLKERLDTGEVEGVDPKAYEVLDGILEFRQVSKIKSTYVDALPALVNPDTGRIHTSYNQTGSATGRVSSNDPNVQNIPVRTELGRRVREAFVAEGAPDWTLLAADYSQIELRVLAHVCRDPGLVEAFRKGEDIHDATASSVYDVAISEVTPEMRRIAKIMNFGVLYGLSPFGIRQQTGLSAEEGRRFIDSYFSSYPGIREYVESVKRDVAENGYVKTLKKRRRYIREIRSRNRMQRAAGERMAINMPIQGTAADIIKIAMVRIQERLDELKMRSMMILQVHDELIFETPVRELEQLKEIVVELMPRAMPLNVPLSVELKTGDAWGDMG